MTQTYTPKHAAPYTETHVITDAPERPEAEDARKILIATPCYGGMVNSEYMQSVLNVALEANRRGIDVDVYTSAGESLITRGRNEAVHEFLTAEKGYTHLLFIDADISFEWINFERLIDSGYEISAGVYPLKTVNWDRLLDHEPHKDKTSMVAKTIEAVVNAVGPSGEDGFAQCLDAGTGFMLIQRSVFEKIQDAHPEFKYTKDNLHEPGTEVWAFFDTMIRDGRYLSEDYMFCRVWQDLGGFVYVDMAAPLLIHHGTYKYGKVE